MMGVLQRLWNVLVVSSASEDDSKLDADTPRLWGPATGINWCEPDYAVVDWCAEFWNTISNLCYIVVAVRCLHRAQQQPLLSHNHNFKYAAIGIGMTGLMSAFFHCTLWWEAQKADEISENAAIVFLYKTLSPRPDPSAHSVSMAPTTHFTFLYLLGMGLGITLVSAFLFCELHLIAILIVTFRRILHAAQSLPPIRRYVRRTGLLTVLGFGCWLVDRIGCSSLLHFCTVWGLPNPQLHAWWHFWTALALNEAFFVCECAYMLPLGTAPMYFPILAREWGKSD
eukprot:m.865494 g.865494  ORF g.865494 m.865494 type:complete len:283 (+) comp23550_c0_seq11:185-1033(+)